MRTIHKIFLIILEMFITLPVMADDVILQEGYRQNGIIYTFYKSKENSVKYGKITGNYITWYSDLVIPEQVSDYPVTIIGDSAFSDCYILKSVVIPNTVQVIGKSAFAYCSGIASVEISNSVQTIGNNAFQGCNITSLTITNSVQYIGDYTFASCDGLEVINYNTIEPIEGNKNIFDDTVYNTATLRIAADGLEMARSISPWKYFSKILANENSIIEDVIVDIDSNEPIEIYNIYGVKVVDGKENLPAGFYIVHQRNRCKKIALR